MTDKPKIFLDLDDVMHGWNDYVIKCFNLAPAEITEVKEGLKKDYFYLENFIGQDKLGNYVQESGASFWENLQLFPWAYELYENCTALAGKENVYFCSSFGKWSAAASVKAKRVKEEFDTDQLILTKYKFLLAQPNRILIDDKPKNIKQWNENGGLGILWPCCYTLYKDFSILNHLFNRIAAGILLLTETKQCQF